MCMDGYGKVGQRCAKCPADESNIAYTTMAFMLLIVVATLWALKVLVQ